MKQHIMTEANSYQPTAEGFEPEFDSKLKVENGYLSSLQPSQSGTPSPSQQTVQSQIHRFEAPNQKVLGLSPSIQAKCRKEKEKRTAAMTTPYFKILTSSCFNSPIPENCIRFVCLSDTHSMVERTEYVNNIPYGDVLLHAGDFTDHGEIIQYELFNELLGMLPHRVKLAIPGNHELTLDPRGLSHDVHLMRKDLGLPDCSESPNVENYKEVAEKLLDLLPNTVILVDAWVSICGIKIYGYPWLPRHGVPGFGLKRQSDLRAKQDLIPDDIDILLSHGPPQGFGDLTRSGKNVGCVQLAKSVSQRIRPKIVLNGHIHEGRGINTDGVTTYINASVCDRVYRPVNNAYVIDYVLPQGYTRQDHVLTLDKKSFTVNNCF